MLYVVLSPRCLDKIKQPGKSLFSRNEELYVSKEVKENALVSEGKSCRSETNRGKSICVSRPLSMKQAARIMHICQENNLPAIEKIHWNEQHFGSG